MSRDAFQIEPIRGLPEALPRGEEILWQGRPAWWPLAREAYGVVRVGGAVAILVAWRLALAASGAAPEANAALAAVLAALGGAALAVLLLTAWLQARETVYTLTSRRAVMRYGLLQTATLQIPFGKVQSADLSLCGGGVGTIAFGARSAGHLSYLLTWPHVRPWTVNPIAPAFRCIPDAGQVARLLAEAARTATALPIVRKAPAPAPVAAE